MTFLNGTSGAQDTTLKVQSTNFFRFHTDGAQWTAGLGEYAYNTLGWRHVVTIGDDYDFPYTQIAGFVAEFCALGGQIDKRIWPPLGEEDYTSYIAQIPDNIDGFYLSVGGTGTIAFVKQYTQLKGNLGDKIIGGSIAIDPSVLAILTSGRAWPASFRASSTDEDSTTPEYTQYVQTLTDSWPDSEDTLIVPVGKGLFGELGERRRGDREALESVNGDLSDGGQAFRDALLEARLRRLHVRRGPITLDENRQAIGNNYVLQRSQQDDGDGSSQDAQDDRERRRVVRGQLQRRPLRLPTGRTRSA